MPGPRRLDPQGLDPQGLDPQKSDPPRLDPPISGPRMKPLSLDPRVNAMRARNRYQARASRLEAKLARALKIKNAGPDRTKSWVAGVGPAPGEFPPAWVPRPERGPDDGKRGPIANPGNKGKDHRKELDHFLYPAMPAAFTPCEIRKLPVEKLRERYLNVMSATMGNHSISLFYCAWTQEQFEEALGAKFRKQIEQVKAQLADRAMFLMHRGMGLVKVDGDAEPNMQVSAALAKVVESLKAKDVEQESGGGFKLIVEGLDRSAPAPADTRPPAVPDRPDGAGH